mgnify:FL=1|tara:strand:- start:62 stop:271 length:210 start_codon:yes stop_codon:yes gene_type:complete
MPDARIIVFDYSRHPITSLERTTLIEYEEDTYLAVWEYDGINGSRNIIDDFSSAEQRQLKKNIRSYLDQ